MLRSSEPSTDVDALVAAADDVGFPVFVKAVAGGGGRGMRRVERAARAARRRSRRRCARPSRRSATPTVFLEQAVVNPRHIEVQILADAEGNVVAPLRAGLLGAAPAPEGRSRSRRRPTSTRELRDRICADAVAFARAIGYVNAGTVEFLLDERGHHVFIEMNPRIQVEHTVTEQVTDRDLVIAQLRIAAGKTLPELHLTQDEITLTGAALQCRVTTEDPSNGFRPDTGMISTYRSPGGPGVRLDGGTTHTGAEVSAHFDSMLVKLTCYGHDFEQRGAPGAAGDRGVPDPRGVDEPAVPGRGARRPGLPGGPASPRASSTSARSCCAPASPPTAARGSSPTWPRPR